MEKNSDILNELQNISPLIAGMGKVNVFKVPDGYFDSISNTVILSLKEDFPVIAPYAQKQDVPEGYFDNLSDSILNKIRNQENTRVHSNETNELPAILSRVSKENLFSVPADYFDTLADAVMNRIKIATEELNSVEECLPAVLQDIKNILPFAVPAEYFLDLPAKILAKVKQDSGAKIISMPKRFSVFKYAAAAMIIGAMALGIYKYSNKPLPAVEPAFTAQLDPSIEKGSVMDDRKFNETLDSLSEEEIVNYLQNNSSESDIAVLSSGVEEKNLPSQEDYLLDNQTLDNFLKEIDTKTN